MNVICRNFFLGSSLFYMACATNHKKNTDIVVIDKPIIQSYDEASESLKKLKNSLVRIKIKNGEEESISTGFFYKTPELLVTALHSFDKQNDCIKKSNCKITLGLAQNAKEVKEYELNAELVLIDSEKDLIYLKVENIKNVMDVAPLMDGEKTNNKDSLAVGGFYQDNPALTFTLGKNISDEKNQNLTSIIVSHGFSGSPVLDQKGRVVGVVSTFKPIKNHKIGLAQFVSLNSER